MLSSAIEDFKTLDSVHLRFRLVAELPLLAHSLAPVAWDKLCRLIWRTGMTFKLKLCAASLLALAVFSGVGYAEGEGDAAQQPATQEQPVTTEQQPAAIPDEILALLNDKRGSAELSDEDLSQRYKAVRRAMKMEGLPDDVRGQLQALAESDKAELGNRNAVAKPAEAPKEEAPAAAAEQPAPEQPKAEQPKAEQPKAEQPAEAAQPAALPDDVLALLNDKRAAAELSDDDLRQRSKAARKVSKMEGLPDDARATVQALLDADKAELDNRKAAAEKEAAEPAPDAPKQAETPPPAALPDDVLQLLADTRPVDVLTPEELTARIATARRAAKDEALPPDLREKLKTISAEARGALAARETPATPATPVAPAEAAAPIVTKEPAGAAAVAPPAPEPAQTDKSQVQALDGNTGNPEAEQKAKAFIADTTPANQLADDALRTRLDGMRDLLAENELSSETERALRKKLRDEREVLRARIADFKSKEDAKAFDDALKQQKADQQKQANAAAEPELPGQKKMSPGNDNRRRRAINFNIIITPDMPRREILRDRRPSDELQEEELRRRIEAYREVQSEDRYLDYDPGMRDYWRQSMQRDRRILRERMLAQREERVIEYRQRPRRVNLNDLAFAEDAPDDVFAAEVDDEDIEKVIVAPPRRKVTKRVQVKDFASNRQLRNSVPHVEVDTIRFGFNEAFVREEEVDNLDQVASVMERVLQRYPREVFLIEGHTDAVGSDGYNLKLSKARAEAVKRTLAQYYLIPAKNLQTVGLGERYLKIPTADPEPENRRVSISRITALVGQAPR
jgi:outer membrane protein OmpA-like peptidoglycan-associated protein